MGIIVDEKFYGNDTVVATGLTQNGKSNVTQFNTFSNRHFTNFESNGDISYLVKIYLTDTEEMGFPPLASKGKRGSLIDDINDSMLFTYAGTASM